MRTNFTTCASTFLNTSNGLSHTFDFTGAVREMLDEKINVHNITAKLITLEGCRSVCGNGNDYYGWDKAANTISTWILPIIGILLQLPFESNAFVQTLCVLARWIGSPIASLSYIFWNIKVTGKCALILDMATAFEDYPMDTDADGSSQFAQMRDSLLILSVMNQYSTKQNKRVEEAEKLIRVALFSDSLQLEVDEDETRNLVKRRQKLARLMRQGRKKGVVPIFISLAWFIFSYVISLQAGMKIITSTSSPVIQSYLITAYGQLGDDAAAHNLGLGLLLAFVPVLNLSSIVDRNPVNADDVRLKLNRFLNAVRRALLDRELRNTYIRSTQRSSDEFEWTSQLDSEDYYRDFFTKFAGQARIRWHYGVAHLILAGIEDAYVTEHGRNWLERPEDARTSFVKGPEEPSDPFWFDFREIWQILASVLVVVGSAGGAYIISYFTPTVGLGCRSGGYMIFVVIALGLLAIEMISWWIVASTVIRRRLEVYFFRPAELTNAAWLIYIVIAQTFGSYNNCKCKASTWGGRGGYVVFKNDATVKDDYFALVLGLQYYWGIGTGVSGLVMLASFAFIVYSWMTQSFLTAEDYQKAMNGLYVTRQFKKYTSYIRRTSDGIIRFFKWMYSHLPGQKRRSHDRIRRSVIWTSRANRWQAGRILKSQHVVELRNINDEEGAVFDEPSNQHLLSTSPLPETHSRSPRLSFGDRSFVSTSQPLTELHSYV